jgi:FkbM family methyltransferase
MNINNKIKGLRAMMAFTNRWQLIFNRLVFGCDADIYIMNDTRFIVDYVGGDAPGTRACIVSDMYRQYFPNMNLGGRISVLDIGANGGGFPLLLKIEEYKFKKVVCVEMNPNTFNRLQFNIYSNICNEVLCINAALTNSVGKIELVLGKGGTSDSIYQDSRVNLRNTKKYEIETRTLDQLIEEHFDSTIDIVKMDIEGAEYAVLLGENARKLEKVRYLIMEIHENLRYEKKQIVEKINSVGFVELGGSSKSNADVYCFVNTRIENA